MMSNILSGEPYQKVHEMQDLSVAVTPAKTNLSAKLNTALKTTRFIGGKKNLKLLLQIVQWNFSREEHLHENLQVLAKIEALRPLSAQRCYQIYNDIYQIYY